MLFSAGRAFDFISEILQALAVCGAIFLILEMYQPSLTPY